VEELCLLEKKKKGRERNGGRLTLSSVVEYEASDFLSSLRTSESKHYRYRIWPIVYIQLLVCVVLTFGWYSFNVLDNKC
jgi:hypothetical protein